MAIDLGLLRETDSEPGLQQELFRKQTGASLQEWIVYKELEARGLEAFVDFQFQSDRFGGLSSMGNAKIHFTIPAGKLAIRVQGRLWSAAPRNAKQLDLMQKFAWEARGWFVADFLHEEVMDNVSRLVDLAFQYRNTPAADSALQG